MNATRERVVARPRAWGCVVVVVAAFALSARAPRYPRAFGLEVLPLVAAAPVLAWLFLRRKLSRRAWLQVTTFLLLHLYGAHYTYANTPLGAALRDALGLARNHYDRAVHGAFGALVLRPLLELFPQPTPARTSLVGVALVVALSTLYEQVEWLAAVVSDPNATAAFLGAQGDVWDAQKDVTCALVGALVSVLLGAVLARARR